MLIRPWSGCSKPAMQRRVVVLPQPLGPSKETNSPGATVKETPPTAATPPKLFARFSTTRPAAADLVMKLTPFVHEWLSDHQQGDREYDLETGQRRNLAELAVLLQVVHHHRKNLQAGGV